MHSIWRQIVGVFGKLPDSIKGLADFVSNN